MTLKNILTTQELQLTKIVLYKTKINFDKKTYNTLKKLILIVGLIYGRNGYIPYKTFITNTYNLLEKKLSPLKAQGFDLRTNNHFFFSIKIETIMNKNIEQIREIVTQQIINWKNEKKHYLPN